jgi:hypothetical protein
MKPKTQIAIETTTRPIGLSTEPEDRMQASTPMPLTTQPQSQTRSSDMTQPQKQSLPRRMTEQYENLSDRASRELDWYFTESRQGEARPSPNPAHREAAAIIGARLAALPAFHRGAIALQYDARDWPKALTSAFGDRTALVVRFECIAHPAIGSRETLERAAAQRLEERIQIEGKDADFVDVLDRQASHCFEKALRAYMRVRGTGLCVAPWPRSGRKRVPPPTPSAATADAVAPAEVA